MSGKCNSREPVCELCNSQQALYYGVLTPHSNALQFLVILIVVTTAERKRRFQSNMNEHLKYFKYFSSIQMLQVSP